MTQLKALVAVNPFKPRVEQLKYTTNRGRHNKPNEYRRFTLVCTCSIFEGHKKLIYYTCAGARDVAEKEHYVQGHGHELAAYYSQLYSI